MNINEYFSNKPTTVASFIDYLNIVSREEFKKLHIGLLPRYIPSSITLRAAMEARDNIEMSGAFNLDIILSILDALDFSDTSPGYDYTPISLPNNLKAVIAAAPYPAVLAKMLASIFSHYQVTNHEAIPNIKEALTDYWVTASTVPITLLPDLKFQPDFDDLVYLFSLLGVDLKQEKQETLYKDTVYNVIVQDEETTQYLVNAPRSWSEDSTKALSVSLTEAVDLVDELTAKSQGGLVFEVVKVERTAVIVQGTALDKLELELELQEIALAHAKLQARKAELLEARAKL